VRVAGSNPVVRSNRTFAFADAAWAARQVRRLGT